MRINLHFVQLGHKLICFCSPLIASVSTSPRSYIRYAMCNCKLFIGRRIFNRDVKTLIVEMLQAAKASIKASG